ncbi:hypothetical protein MMC24_003682 [Lignoscripta atroalba]|nr:hypothetical protein [Lignoscripta atroalba]
MPSRERASVGLAAPRRKPLKRKLRLRPVMKKLRKATMKYRKFDNRAEMDFDEPLILGQRAVMRAHRQLPVAQLVGLHRLYKDDQGSANKVLALFNEKLNLGNKSDERQNVINRCAIRALFEERLKKTAQLSGVFPCDPNTNRRTQELFEQFFQAHGEPNEAEQQLLALVGRTAANNVDEWFAAKKYRLRSFGGVRSSNIGRQYMARKLLLQKGLYAQAQKKPPTRH